MVPAPVATQTPGDPGSWLPEPRTPLLSPEGPLPIQGLERDRSALRPPTRTVALTHHAPPASCAPPAPSCAPGLPPAGSVSMALTTSTLFVSSDRCCTHLCCRRLSPARAAAAPRTVLVGLPTVHSPPVRPPLGASICFLVHAAATTTAATAFVAPFCLSPHPDCPPSLRAPAGPCKCLAQTPLSLLRGTDGACRCSGGGAQTASRRSSPPRDAGAAGPRREREARGLGAAHLRLRHYRRERVVWALACPSRRGTACTGREA